MSGDNTRQVILRGGKGGQGNQHYATSTMQAPKYAQPGQDAIEIEDVYKRQVCRLFAGHLQCHKGFKP